MRFNCSAPTVLAEALPDQLAFYILKNINNKITHNVGNTKVCNNTSGEGRDVASTILCNS